MVGELNAQSTSGPGTSFMSLSQLGKSRDLCQTGPSVLTKRPKAGEGTLPVHMEIVPGRAGGERLEIVELSPFRVVISPVPQHLAPAV